MGGRIRGRQAKKRNQTEPKFGLRITPTPLQERENGRPFGATSPGRWGKLTQRFQRRCVFLFGAQGSSFLATLG